MEFHTACEAIADRFAIRHNRLIDGQNVRDHAYRQLGRCSTIRRIAAGSITRQYMAFHAQRKTKPLDLPSHAELMDSWRS